jgi:hypothetical protein
LNTTHDCVSHKMQPNSKVILRKSKRFPALSPEAQLWTHERAHNQSGAYHKRKSNKFELSLNVWLLASYEASSTSAKTCNFRRMRVKLRWTNAPY